MSTLLTLMLAYTACRLLPRIVAETVATALGVLLVVRSRRARQANLACRPASGAAVTWDERPTTTQRRALRRSLNAALDMTEFTSLLPRVAARADRLADTIERLAPAATHGLARLRVTGLDPVQRG
ncbi:hypothetical protein [Sphingomonas olei]|jgi:hypothetical protein|uniref:Uncharacterized protein n=1 Tax=Sphingomonas olei TaxID=1886787 RepID=A0ABY2QDD0_9SPHN|nr:hypothetical protein [Sphingomonas olei]THG36806.1 hypothetical protein E5988_16525 [Sphingomonas olei]